MIFNLEYLLHADTIDVLKVPVYYYQYTKGSLVSQNETMKECEILFRICEITPEANKKAENLISIFTGKHTEHFKNVQMNGSLLHRSVNK